MAAFLSPKLSLDSAATTGIRTLPDLVDFHAKHNPQHIFCIQTRQDHDSISVSFKKLQRAIVRCQARLRRDHSDLHPPAIDAEGHVAKCAPVAILMESHVGLAIYVLVCMGMGVPVVLLSARLNPSAVRHLLKETGSRHAVVSPQLLALASEAISPAEETNRDTLNGDGATTIRIATEWESLLDEENAADESKSGFSFVAICLSLGAGKTVCIPPPSRVPDGASVVNLLQRSGATALISVPSILEEIEGLPDNKGAGALARLELVGFGGGMPKEAVGQRLDAFGVRLIGHQLQVKLDRVDNSDQQIFAYRLSMVPFGWTQRFELQDLIITTTEYTAESDLSLLDFSVTGRTDDLICLATGEKVRPTILESLLRQCDGVKDAITFGEGQFELGIIVEATDALNPDHFEQFKTTIWPQIEDASRQMDAHAKITSPAAVLVVPSGDLPRSDKGTILRKAVATKYAEEIADVYRNFEVAVAPALNLSSPLSSIKAFVAESMAWQANDQDDFFARGMDSLQATKLRRLLKGSVQATHSMFGSDASHVLPVASISNDFVYRHPSISSIVGALFPENDAIEEVLTEAQLFEQLVSNYTGRYDHTQEEKAVVVLTGSKGSLGSFFLAQLLSNSSVSRVICLNRPGKGADALKVQKSALTSRNISVNDVAWAKVEVYEVSTEVPWLGLSKEVYENLATESTHIVHIAWPMNFQMGVQSYESSFKTLRNLLELARRARFYSYKQKPRLLFISSISTVGNHPLPPGQNLISEVIPDGPASALDLGYAKTKLVCEKMIQRAASDYPEIEVGVVRVGQISGAANGYWNANEHFVATLSWLPVDSAAQALSEILFHGEPLRLVYNLENPTRQSWEHAVALLSRELQIPASSIVPLDQWLDHVASAPGPENPAANVIDFLKRDFSKMSCGSVVLDTSGHSRESEVVRVITGFKQPVQDPPSYRGVPQEKTGRIETVVFTHTDKKLPLRADIHYPSSQQAMRHDTWVTGLVIHGGGHVMLSRQDIRPLQMQLLLDNGVLPVSVDYRLCPETTILEGPLVDIANAYAWARKSLPYLKLTKTRVNEKLDHSKAVVVGWSTGGTLAMSLAWTSIPRGISPPTGILAFYCPTDYEDEFWQKPNVPEHSNSFGNELYNVIDGVHSTPTTAYKVPSKVKAAAGWIAPQDPRSRIVLHMNWHGQTLPVLFRGLPAGQTVPRQAAADFNRLEQPPREDIIQASPYAQILQGNYKSPTHIVFGTKDDLIPWEQAQRTFDAMQQAGIESGLTIAPGQPHLFDLYRDPDGSRWGYIMEGYKYLLQTLGRKINSDRELR
ncbi:hypothetical protein PDE_09743 [Penicillium oxalicum 114-2]|uniref:Polyketide synthase phosphopantetheine-binding domain-containing protein n=1 Tax=Penicillium oxalicum (strain 114-2 / CGMCC 5302) TaxID=933388 RepID=S7ZWG0_PENO1|nr:hypothetical protein PDE_09743 [Penicillium oxalicum 114-2]